MNRGRGGKTPSHGPSRGSSNSAAGRGSPKTLSSSSSVRSGYAKNYRDGRITTDPARPPVRGIGESRGQRKSTQEYDVMSGKKSGGTKTTRPASARKSEWTSSQTTFRPKKSANLLSDGYSRVEELPQKTPGRSRSPQQHDTASGGKSTRPERIKENEPTAKFYSRDSDYAWSYAASPSEELIRKTSEMIQRLHSAHVNHPVVVHSWSECGYRPWWPPRDMFEEGYPLEFPPPAELVFSTRALTNRDTTEEEYNYSSSGSNVEGLSQGASQSGQVRYERPSRDSSQQFSREESCREPGGESYAYASTGTSSGRAYSESRPVDGSAENERLVRMNHEGTSSTVHRHSLYDDNLTDSYVRGTSTSRTDAHFLRESTHRALQKQVEDAKIEESAGNFRRAGEKQLTRAFETSKEAGLEEKEMERGGALQSSQRSDRFETNICANMPRTQPSTDGNESTKLDYLAELFIESGGDSDRCTYSRRQLRYALHHCRGDVNEAAAYLLRIDEDAVLESKGDQSPQEIGRHSIDGDRLETRTSPSCQRFREDTLINLQQSFPNLEREAIKVVLEENDFDEARTSRALNEMLETEYGEKATSQTEGVAVPSFSYQYSTTADSPRTEYPKLGRPSWSAVAATSESRSSWIESEDNRETLKRIATLFPLIDRGTIIDVFIECRGDELATHEALHQLMPDEYSRCVGRFPDSNDPFARLQEPTPSDRKEYSEHLRALRASESGDRQSNVRYSSAARASPAVSEPRTIVGERQYTHDANHSTSSDLRNWQHISESIKEFQRLKTQYMENASRQKGDIRTFYLQKSQELDKAITELRKENDYMVMKERERVKSSKGLNAGSGRHDRNPHHRGRASLTYNEADVWLRDPNTSSNYTPSVTEGHEFDLHGLSMWGAVDYVVEELIPAAASNGIHKFHLIVGRGNHSRTPGRSVLAEKLGAVLREQKAAGNIASFQSGDATITVRVT
eukprot:gb/GECG01013603.1/.p1 GENE.gb/GECG01013603.1/~~gb/GECG01013603.1/.p1  ORF type:complete len:969 (+),score=102.44 gb/GECG01013603.1/:1-2907(+)